uniref:Uncharacterized protein n=1 Tax=Tetranychus urticae TaxID=32264 RepID=T1KPF3_TETUR
MDSVNSVPEEEIWQDLEFVLCANDLGLVMNETLPVTLKYPDQWLSD